MDKFDYGCLMIEFDVPLRWREWQQALVPREDLHPEYGFSDHPHVTVLFGFEKQVNLDDVRPYLFDLDGLAVKFHSLSCFHPDPEYSVLKFDVSCDKLHYMNAVLTDSFPYHNEFGQYKPHMTVGYLKPEVCDKFAAEIDPFTLEPSRYVFSYTDGTRGVLDNN